MKQSILDNNYQTSFADDLHKMQNRNAYFNETKGTK